MLLRCVSSLFFVLGLALLVAAGFGYVADFAEPARVTIDEPERELEAIPGEALELVFVVQNPTWHTARIVGLAEC
jgi:hypothetical protein